MVIIYLTFDFLLDLYHNMFVILTKSVKSNQTFVEKELALTNHLHSYPVFCIVRVAQSLVFCVAFCRSLIIFFRLSIVLSVLLRFTTSDYPFGMFNLFSMTINLPQKKNKKPQNSVSIKRNKYLDETKYIALNMTKSLFFFLRLV